MLFIYWMLIDGKNICQNAGSSQNEEERVRSLWQSPKLLWIIKPKAITGRSGVDGRHDTEHVRDHDGKHIAERVREQ